MKKELTLAEMQEIEWKMLKYLHDICVANHLTYYLYGGTLLGAIRHQGFIPWDDDLDIILPRKDYDQLLKILAHKTEYTLLSYEYVEDYYYPIAKLVDPSTRLKEFGMKECSKMGVWVDLFPLDNTSNHPRVRWLHMATVRKLVNFNRYLAAGEDTIQKQLNSTRKKFNYWLAKRFKSHALIKLIHKLSSHYKDKKTNYKADIIWGHRMDIVLEAKWFGEPVAVKFGDGYFNAPTDAHAFLTRVYGDYMKLPPENKRHSEHMYSCWRKDLQEKENDENTTADPKEK